MLEIELYIAAERYANIWALKEEALVHGIASRSAVKRLEALRRAAGHFKVARSFGTAFDLELGIARLEPALNALDSITRVDVTHENLRKVIGELRRELGRPYGGADLLSAATKFLWLRYREVVIIHDSQARSALQAPHGDYGEFLDRWKYQYELVRPEIINACNRIQHEIRLSSRTNAYSLESNIATEWFRRRVFDIYLWTKGKPSRTVSNTRSS